MERHARLLLRFCHALSRTEVPTEAFCFGTRLTRITPQLRTRDPTRRWTGSRPRSGTGRAARASATAFHEFNQRWARRVLRSSGIVLVVSDGWDRGDPARGGRGDGPPAAHLPPAHLAQPAGGRHGLPAAGRGHGGGLAPHRRVPARRTTWPAWSCSRQALPTTPGARDRDDPPMKDLRAPSCLAWDAEGPVRAAPPHGRVGRSWCARSALRRGRRARCMLVSGDGRLAGSVSGGCVEGAAYEEVERARATGHARVIRYGISDEQAWDVGLACGGTIDVLVEPVVRRVAVAPRPRAGPGGHHAAARRFAGRRPSGRTSRGRARRPSRPSCVDARGALAGTTGDAAADAQLAAAAATRWSAAARGPSSSPADRGSSRPSRAGRGWSSWARSRWPSRSCAIATHAGLRDGGHRRPADVRDPRALPRCRSSCSWAGPTSSPTQSASGRATRSRC